MVQTILLLFLHNNSNMYIVKRNKYSPTIEKRIQYSGLDNTFNILFAAEVVQTVTLSIHTLRTTKIRITQCYFVLVLPVLFLRP
jgi:hypothetical protein